MSKNGIHFHGFIKGITIEPMVLLYFASNAIATFGSTNLLLLKSCHPGDTTAPDYTALCPDKKQAEKVLTVISSWTVILEHLLPVYLTIVLGTWSDTHGKRRKPLLFIPLCGEMITAVFLMFSSYVFSISPEITAAILVIIRGVTGGTVLFGLGAITYISDISSLEDRVWRVGLIISLTLIGSPLSTALSGVLLDYFGFSNLFLMCTLLNINALFLGVFLMKNSAIEESIFKRFEGIFYLSYLPLLMKTLFKKRSGYNRLVLCLMGLTAPRFIVCFMGESSLLHSFVSNKFHMNESEFGFYSIYKLLTLFFGTFISVFICSKLIKLSDEVIGGLGNITHIISLIGMFFATNTSQLYAFTLMDLLHSAVYIAGRSIISKVVDGNEVGQVNSVLAIVDSVIPIAVIPLYKAVYELFPGVIYFLSVFIPAGTFLLFLITWVIRGREEDNEFYHI